MRITKQVLARRWAISSVLAALVFAILAWSDLRLKSLSGFGTADLQGFATADQYRQAFLVWPSRYAVRAGFNWGLDYLLMPLYAAAFFYSGILAREAFAPRPGRLRRILTLLSAVPIAGAVLDAVENALQLTLMFSGLIGPAGADRACRFQRQMGGDLCRGGAVAGGRYWPAGRSTSSGVSDRLTSLKKLSLTAKRLCVYSAALRGLVP